MHFQVFFRRIHSHAFSSIQHSKFKKWLKAAKTETEEVLQESALKFTQQSQRQIKKLEKESTKLIGRCITSILVL